MNHTKLQPVVAKIYTNLKCQKQGNKLNYKKKKKKKEGRMEAHNNRDKQRYLEDPKGQNHTTESQK